MPLVPQIVPLVEKPQKRPSPVRMEGTTTTSFHSSRIFTTTTTTPLPILMQTLQPLTIKVCLEMSVILFVIFSQFSTIAVHRFARDVIFMRFVKIHSVFAIRAGKGMEL